MTPQPTPAPITLPEMCKTHQALLVRQCGYQQQDPWRALLIATQLALFQGATADSKVRAELGGHVERITGLGCLACRKPDLFGELIHTVQRSSWDTHMSAIKRLGERWVARAALPKATVYPRVDDSQPAMVDRTDNQSTSDQESSQ